MSDVVKWLSPPTLNRVSEVRILASELYPIFWTVPHLFGGCGTPSVDSFDLGVPHPRETLFLEPFFGQPSSPASPNFNSYNFLSSFGLCCTCLEGVALTVNQLIHLICIRSASPKRTLFLEPFFGQPSSAASTS